MLRIKEGSVFDEKCDLLILPCNSAGGVTQWVHDEAVENDIPLPDRKIPFGRALFLPTGAHYTKADFIGYAASVNASLVESDLKAIRSLLSEIVTYCKNNDCSIANLPVLGVGAGRLDAADVLDLYRRTLEAEPETYNVYIPDRETARLFIERNPNWEPHSRHEEEHPRVFISYSWKDEAVKDWVFSLANKLCANGVDARLDRFHLRPGMDLPQWMTNEVLKANKVLLVCDSHYAAKADMRKAGVGWETMIIQGDMMMQGEMNTKYVVIAFGDFEKNTPIYMKSKLAIGKDEIDQNFDRLLEQIFDIDAAPKIGEIPDWVKSKRKAAKN
ncbi:MAG: toll/interleukin-1 receptor domain-containing protein [Zoogloea sp.]|nr:toll/interleukin-1 receptor domain-containing protein [Zoogloea sp.]